MNRDFLALALIVIIGALYFHVSVAYPIVFGDEGYYSSVGRYMANTGQYPIYEPYYTTDIYHQLFFKPPVYFFANAGAWLIAGELGLKFLIPMFSVLSALMLYLFFRSNGRPELGIASSLALLLLPGMVTYGVLDYVETAGVLFVTSALYFGYRALNTGDRIHALLAGCFAGLGLATEVTTMFALPVLLVWLFLSKNFGRWKTLLLIFVVVLLVVSPFFVRNLVLYHGFCYNLLPGDCTPVSDIAIPHDASLDAGFVSDIVRSGGTSVSGFQMGVLNYFNFAFGWTATILFLFGISFALIRKDRPVSFMMVWLFFFLLLTAQQAVFGGRAEDTPRYTLFGFPALASIAGLTIAEAYGWLNRKHVALGLAAAVLLCAALLPYGYAKLDTMGAVKTFAPGFFDGCKWIRANTDQDALFFTIYGHHTAYQCERRNLNVLPDKAEIQLTNDNRSYEHLKLHGFDYVFIQQFTVSTQSTRETVTPDFVNYLDTSGHFKKVYDNTATYGTGGVKVYKVL